VSSFQAPTGTRDVLAPESARVETLVQRFAHQEHLAGYGRLRPVLHEGPDDRNAHHQDLVERAQPIPTILELLG